MARSSSSSTNTPAFESSTAAPPTVEEAYLRHMASQQKPLTPAAIRAQGDIKTRIGILWFVGVITCLLIAIGGVALFVIPDKSQEVWVIIGPIISSAVTGTVAFFTGERQGKNQS